MLRPCQMTRLLRQAPDADSMDPEVRAWESYISPHFRRKDLGPDAPKVEQLVAVFADRVWGWQIDIADRLMKSEEHGGFAVLAIVAGPTPSSRRSKPRRGIATRSGST